MHGLNIKATTQSTLYIHTLHVIIIMISTHCPAIAIPVVVLINRNVAAPKAYVNIQLRFCVLYVFEYRTFLNYLAIRLHNKKKLLLSHTRRGILETHNTNNLSLFWLRLFRQIYVALNGHSCGSLSRMVKGILSVVMSLLQTIVVEGKLPMFLSHHIHGPPKN